MPLFWRIFFTYVYILPSTVVDCRTLSNPVNGQVNTTAGTTFGQTATYSCNTGYNLMGNSTRTCQATGQWNGSEPTCERMLYISYQVCTGSKLNVHICRDNPGKSGGHIKSVQMTHIQRLH